MEKIFLHHKFKVPVANVPGLEVADVTIDARVDIGVHGNYTHYTTVTINEDDTKHHGIQFKSIGGDSGARVGDNNVMVNGLPLRAERLLNGLESGEFKVSGKLRNRRYGLPYFPRDVGTKLVIDTIRQYADHIDEMSKWVQAEVDKIRASVKIHTPEEITGPGSYYIEHRGHVYQFCWSIEKSYVTVSYYPMTTKQGLQVSFKITPTNISKAASTLLSRSGSFSLCRVTEEDKLEQVGVAFSTSGSEKGWIPNPEDTTDLMYVLEIAHLHDIHSMIHLALGHAGFLKLAEVYSRYMSTALSQHGILADRQGLKMSADESLLTRMKAELAE